MSHHERPDRRPLRTGEDSLFRDHTCELRAENARLERLLQTFSHDLRSQLMVASGHLELARTESDPTDHLDAIEHAHDRIEALIADVSTLGTDGNVVGQRESVVLERLVEDCWASIETTGATLVVDADTTIRADTSRLAQVFENLFRNSVEHGRTNGRTPSDGADLTVTVGLLPNGRGFFIEDDGTGIPAEQRERAFEAGVSTSDDGTGLGLAIVCDVVGAHGWGVELADGDDGGARFEITGVDLRPPEA